MMDPGSVESASEEVLTSSSGLILGDEAVALGAMHAGITAAYAYPGTPSTEIFEYLVRHGPEQGIAAHWCANEKTAYEQALGASMAGTRVLVSMKHVGLNVAADPFVNSARSVLCDPAVDVGVVGCVPLTPALNTLPVGPGHPEDLARPDGVVAAMQALWRDSTKACVCVVDAGPRYDELATSLLGVGIPTFGTVDRALRALELYMGWRMAAGEVARSLRS